MDIWEALLEAASDLWYIKVQEGLVAFTGDRFAPGLKHFTFSYDDDTEVHVDVSLLETEFQGQKMLLLTKEENGQRITTLVQATGENIARFARL